MAPCAQHEGGDSIKRVKHWLYNPSVKALMVCPTCPAAHLDGHPEHLPGDQLLQLAAQRLAHTVRSVPVDTTAAHRAAQRGSAHVAQHSAAHSALPTLHAASLPTYGSTKGYTGAHRVSKKGCAHQAQPMLWGMAAASQSRDMQARPAVTARPAAAHSQPAWPWGRVAGKVVCS